MLVRDAIGQADGLLELTVEASGARPCAGDRVVVPLVGRGMASCELLSCTSAEACGLVRLTVAAPACALASLREVGLVSRATVWSGNLELPHVAASRLVAGLWLVPDSYGADPINVALAQGDGTLHLHWRRYPNSYKILAGAERAGSPFARRDGVTMGEVLDSAWYQRFVRHACQTGSAVLQGGRLALVRELLAGLADERAATRPEEGSDVFVLAVRVGGDVLAFERPLGASEGAGTADRLVHLLLECVEDELGAAGTLIA